MLAIETLPLRLRADPSRVVVRPFHLSYESNLTGQSRVDRIVDAVLNFTPQEIETTLRQVNRDFAARHHQMRRIYLKRYREISKHIDPGRRPEEEATQQLIGAYFCHEYSYAAAALMNPSIVPHYDQSGMAKGSQRLIMSMRAVGEGHISSIAFRVGILADDGELYLTPEPPFATAADTNGENGADGSVTVHRSPDSTLAGTVIFPITPAQSNGLEDLRLVRFDHGDRDYEWLGTYTAYDGREIRTEMLRTRDFRDFELVPLSGSAAVNKGMALFPRKIGGQYMMVGRQDGQKLYLLTSDDLTSWEGGELLLSPVYPWELVQIGNCGSPIELDEGWLVLTHGVGAMRQYAIGAVLLDKADPSKVLGRTSEPILAAADEDREGYVPNVVYSCGAMRHGNSIFLPYGIADSSIAFANIAISELLSVVK